MADAMGRVVRDTGGPQHDEAKRLQADSDAVGATLESDIFAAYSPSHPNPGPPHPGDVCEAASLAATLAPRADYPLVEPLLVGGKLSSLQLETILLASQRHLTILPMQPPTRCGFFLGDGAGVGKGRQLAGLILDSVSRGRMKHLWFSSSSDLRTDAIRDLKDLGCYLQVHDGCQGLDRGNKGLGFSAGMRSGIVFSTYATLVSATTAQRQRGASRLQQLVDWCGGPSFDGCLMLDECHKAKNFQPGKEEASSKVAHAVIELQRALPMARVVYCSATGASDLSNMAYMERLGLWGAFSAFDTFEAFMEGVQNRGVGGLEMLAMEMKASGSYVSRGLSYRDAEFEVARVALTDAQRVFFDAASRFWAERLLPSLEEAASATQAPMGALTRQFWSAHQRFFKQLCVSCKVPALVQRVRTALADGYAVVIGLQSTGEAALDRAVATDGDLRAPISLCRAILSDTIELHFPVAKVADAKLEKELTKAEAALASASETLASCRAACATRAPPSLEARTALAYAERLKAQAQARVETVRLAVEADRSLCGQHDPQCAEERERLLREAAALELPPAALDLLIDELGGKSAVAEMTGRKGRVVRTPDGRRFAFEHRAKPESSEMENLNVSERNAFMDGKKMVAIISDAASTGISLQADRRVANQRRRFHITLELPWSADKAVQQLGRTHRANQLSAPLYLLLNTDVGGEARFASAVARRLQALGALTKGDRRAEIGNLDSFNFDNMWGKRALKLLLHGLYDGTSPQPAIQEALVSPHLPLLIASLDILGASSPADRDKMEVRRFLNRLLGLPLAEQTLLFDLFGATLESVLSAARKDGKYDEGIADLAGASVSLEEPEAQLWTDPLTGAQMRSALVRVDRGVSWEAACAKLVARESEVGASEGVHTAMPESGPRRDSDTPAGETEICAERGGARVDDIGEAGADGGEGSAAGGSGEDCDVELLSESDEDEVEMAVGAAETKQGAGAAGEASQLRTPSAVEDPVVPDGGVIAGHPSSRARSRCTHRASARLATRPAAPPRSAAFAGFCRSRFLQSGERLYILALPRTNREGLYLITRPSTGSSPFEEEETDLRRKYERISPQEARDGWTAAYDAALHENVGGRLSHLQMLTGSTLPLLPLLERLVKAHAASLTKRDQAVAAVRVQMDDRRLVGMRFPRALMSTLRAELLAFHAQRRQGTQRLAIETVAPVDAATYALATRPAQTLKSFFGVRTGGASSASSVSSATHAPASSSRPQLPASPAAVPPAALAADGSLAPIPPPCSGVLGSISGGGATSAIDLTDSPTKADAKLAEELQRSFDAEAGPRAGRGGGGRGRGSSSAWSAGKAPVAAKVGTAASSSTSEPLNKRKSVLEMLQEKQRRRSE